MLGFEGDEAVPVDKEQVGTTTGARTSEDEVAHTGGQWEVWEKMEEEVEAGGGVVWRWRRSHALSVYTPSLSTNSSPAPGASKAACRLSDGLRTVIPGG